MQTVAMLRERQIQVRFSTEEGARLDAVAAHYGLNPQAVIRMLVKQAADLVALRTAEPGSMPEAMGKRVALENVDAALALGARFALRASKKTPPAAPTPTKPAKKSKK